MTLDEITWWQMVDETRDLTAGWSNGPATQLAHLTNVMIGYRETILDPETTPGGQPYPPGSASDKSWQLGHRLAKADLARR